MKKIVLFQGAVCEVMNLAGGKCLVRDSKGDEFEVYSHDLQDIPLSKELLEYLGFRFDEERYKIKGCKCYKLAKISKKYLTSTDFIEVEEPTPQISYAVLADGEERFSIFTQTFIDNRIGTHWVNSLDEFLRLCEHLDCHIDVDIMGLDVFMRAQKVS